MFLRPRVFGLLSFLKKLSPIQEAIQKIKVAGRNGVIGGAAINPDGSGHWFLDRNRTVPFNPATYQETLTGIQYIDDLTGLPVGWALGPQILENSGGPFVVSTGWIDQAGGAGLTVVDGWLRCVAAASGSRRLEYSFPAVVGKTYTVAVQSRGTGALPRMSAFVGIENPQNVSLSTSGGVTSYTFRTTSTSVLLRFYINGASANTGEQIELRSATVREVIRDESWMGPELFVGLTTLDAGWVDNLNGTYTGTATSSAIRQVTAGSPLSAGRVFRVEFEVSGYSAGSVRAYVNSGGFGAARSSNGIFAEYIAAAGINSANFSFLGFSGFSGTIRPISVREIPGNPIVSAVLNQGPIPTKRVNLLSLTEFSTGLASTNSNGGGISESSLAGYAGALRYDNASATTWAYKGSGWTVAPSTGYLISFVVKFDDNGPPIFTPGTAGNTAGNSLAVLLGGQITPASDISFVDLGGGLYRVNVSTTSSASPNTSTGLVQYVSQPKRPFVTTAWDVRPAYFNATNFPGIPAYQRVGDGTAGVFDYDHVGFPQLLKQNAAGNAALMTLGTVDMTGTDAGAILAAVVKTSDVATGVVAEFGNLNTTNGSLTLSAPSGPGTRIGFGSRGSNTAVLDANSSAFAAPFITSLIGSGDISADVTNLISNGVTAGTPNTSDQGSGNLGNHRFNICARRDVNNTPSLPFTGLLVGGPPALVPADIGIDLLALSKALAAEGGYVYGAPVAPPAPITSWAQLFTAMGSPPGLAYDMTDAATMSASRTGGAWGVGPNDPIGYVLDVSRGAIDAAGPGVHANATSDARRPVYGSFDGGAAMAAQFPATAGNSLQTVAALDLTSTDEVHVFAAVRSLANATAIIAELTNNWSTATGAFGLVRLTNDGYYFGARGTLSGQTNLTGFPGLPDTALLYGRLKISDAIRSIKRNSGAPISTSASLGTGNMGNHLLNIGARNAAAPSTVFNGRIARLAIIGGPMTAEQIAAATALTGAGLMFSP